MAPETVTPPPAPPERRRSVLTILSRILLAITCLLAGVVTVAGLSLFRERHAILLTGIHAAEEVASGLVGAPITVGSVSGPYWNGLELRDVKVYGWKGPHAPVIATLPRVRAAYAIAEILRLGPRPIQVDVYDPTFALARDRAGRLNYRPTFPQTATGSTEVPRLPRVAVTVHGGRLTWRDAAAQQPFGADVRLIDGHVSLANQVVRFSGALHEGGTGILTQGSLRLADMGGEVKTEVHDLPTARWINYLAPNPDAVFTGGAAQVKVGVSWPDPHGVKLEGTVALDDVSLDVKGVRRPIEKVRARASFDLARAVVSEIGGQLCDQHFEGHGEVLDLTSPAPHLAFTGGAQTIDLAALVPLVPDLANWQISGKGSATAVVEGTTLDPIAKVRATVPEGHVYRQTAKDVTATIRYQANVAEIPSFAATLNGGQVTGNGQLVLTLDPGLRFDATYRGVEVPATLAAYAQLPVPLAGSAEGTVQVRGSAMHPLVTGNTRVEGGRLVRQEIASATGTFRYEDHHWQVPNAALLAGNATLTARVVGDDAGAIAGSYGLSGFGLDTLSALGLDLPITGTGVVRGTFSMDAARPNSLRSEARVAIRDGHAYGLPVNSATASAELAGTRLALMGVRLAGAEGQITGTVDVDWGQPKARTDVTFEGHGLDLGQLEPLRQAVTDSLGPVHGTLAATGSVHVLGEAWRLEADAMATGVSSERMGHLQRVWGPVRIADGRLALPDMHVAMDGGAEAIAQGTLDFTMARPVVDMQLSMRDARAREVLQSFNWPQILRGTWIGRPFAADNAGPERPYASLAAKPPEKGHPVPLKAVLEHWQRTHLEPLAQTQEDAGAWAPFWDAVDGRLALDLAMQGPLDKPELRTRVRLADGTAWGHTLERAQLTAGLRDDTITLSVLDLVEAGAGGASVQARGTLGPNSALEVYGSNLDLAWVNPYLRGQEIRLGGRGSFRLLAKGDPTDPKLDMVAELGQAAIAPGRNDAEAEANRFTFDSAEAKGTYYRGQLAIESARILKEGKEARVSGHLPVVPGMGDDTLDVSMDLSGESLGMVTALTRGEIQWKGGAGAVNVKLGGTLANPELSGAVDLKGVAFRERNLTSDVTDVQAYATISSSAITLQRATARYGGGTIVGAGQILLKQFTPDRLRLQAVAHQIDLALTSGLYQGMVEASVEVTGPVTHPAIGGTLTVSKGTVDLDALTPPAGPTSATAPAVPVDLRDLTVHIHQGVNVLGAKLPASALTNLRLMDVLVDGSLAVNGPLANPQPKGTIFVRSGTFTPLIYTFDNVHGTVEFGGDRVAADSESSEYADLLPEAARTTTSSDISNAHINVTAQGQVYSYNKDDFSPPKSGGGQLDVKVTVTGTLSNMERKFECADQPQLTSSRIEQILGKESLVTAILKPQGGETGEQGPTTTQIVSNEVAGFLSTASRRFFTPYTSQVQNLLQLESLGFDFVSPEQLNQQSMFANLGLSPSLYTQTRPFLFNSVSLSGRYTFRPEQNVYQAGLNVRLADRVTILNTRIVDNVGLQASLDNRQLNVGANGKQNLIELPLMGGANPSITLTILRGF